LKAFYYARNLLGRLRRVSNWSIGGGGMCLGKYGQGGGVGEPRGRGGIEWVIWVEGF